MASVMEESREPEQPAPRRRARSASFSFDRVERIVLPSQDPPADSPESRSSTPETVIFRGINDEEDPDEMANAIANLDISGNRSPASPASSMPGQANSNGNGANYMSPLPAGHQQDLQYLYGQIVELSNLLAKNREKTAELSKLAENVGRQQSDGERTDDSSADNDKAVIQDLKRQLARSNTLVEAYKHEQRENTKLIADYEDALGTATEQIRNYCLGIDERFLSQTRKYNDLLQQEKDDHLESRLRGDYYFAETLKLAGMIRHATRLRCDEWGEEYLIISQLQGQVRCYRRVLGMDAEKPEEETGWPYLKDQPHNDMP